MASGSIIFTHPNSRYGRWSRTSNLSGEKAPLDARQESRERSDFLTEFRIPCSVPSCFCDLLQQEVGQCCGGARPLLQGHQTAVTAISLLDCGVGTPSLGKLRIAVADLLDAKPATVSRFTFCLMSR
jgi:hypothetical protein